MPYKASCAGPGPFRAPSAAHAPAKTLPVKL